MDIFNMFKDYDRLHQILQNVFLHCTLPSRVFVTITVNIQQFGGETLLSFD